MISANVFEASPTERLILADIEQRTGLKFRRVGGIDTHDESLAKAVLPTLAEWVENLNDPRHRLECYLRFLTVHAHALLDQMIRWWMRETDPVGVSCLTQALTLALKCDDAEKIWHLYHELPKRAFQYQLLSRLAECPAVQREVREYLVAAVETESLRLADLSFIAKVQDPRIREWFNRQTESPDPRIRVLAKRVTSNLSLPAGLEYSQSPPDRTSEVFSTECDLADVRFVLERIANYLGLRFPKALLDPDLLANAELNRWIVANSRKPGKSFHIWFRLEDVSTVEIVVLT